ncbi:MAG TPA: universal stress protein, partial [Rhodothermales bacterium]|nr:universal stress protein [Rhodothermales bacterium]
MTIQTLLFPTDFSDCAEGAFSHAAFLAERFGATLHVLHVQEDPEADEPNWAEALTISTDDIYRDLRIPAEEQDPSFGLIDLKEHEAAARDVAASILHHAATLGADLIVM